MSNVNETRLRRRLFDPEYQEDDLTTTPVASENDIMHIDFSINIIKLIDLVKRVVRSYTVRQNISHFALDRTRVNRLAYQQRRVYAICKTRERERERERVYFPPM